MSPKYPQKPTKSFIFENRSRWQLKIISARIYYWSAHKLTGINNMIETVCLIITTFSVVSREIRAWIELRKREKDDESHPPFLVPFWHNILYLI